MSEAEVRTAFAKQAAICASLGALFTGRLCGLIGQNLDRSSEIGRRVLDWSGNPSHEGDALPLRLAGGLHALARSGKDVGLTAVYPPRVAPDNAELWVAVSAALQAYAGEISLWLDGPPQTNEVGRSGGLMAGLLVLTERFGLPFALYELGASAGLNTQLDRYAYRLGETTAGEAGSTVLIAPEWRGGSSPPSGEVRVIRRAGVDQHPLDPADATARDMLSAYVWADQRERLARLEAALEIAQTQPTRIVPGDAAAWLETVLAMDPETGICRVVMHTIAFQYFPPEVQARVRARIEAVGALATEDAPLAWLSFEAESSGYERGPMLRLRAWPGGESVALAQGHPHGTWYEWLAQAG